MSADAVVVRADDVSPERWEDPVRGHLDFRPLVGTSGATDQLVAGVAELEPGGWLGLHRHGPAEVYHVLAGTGTMTAGDATHPLEPGTTVWVPAGLTHGVRNTGGSPLRILYTFAVDSDDDVDYDFLGSD